MLERGDIIETDSADRGTSIIFAAHRGLADVTKKMMRKCANPSARINNEMRRFSLASQMNYAELAKILVDGGSKESAEVAELLAAMNIAAHKGHADVDQE